MATHDKHTLHTLYMYVHTYTHTYIHTYIYTHIHTYTHTYLDISVYTQILYIYISTRACVCVSLCLSSWPGFVISCCFVWDFGLMRLGAQPCNVTGMALPAAHAARPLHVPRLAADGKSPFSGRSQARESWI